MSKLILSHPTGNEFSRAAAKAFLKAGMLEKFYTSVGIMPGSLWYKFSNYRPFKELKRRAFEEIPIQQLRTHSFKEIARLIAIKLRFKKLVQHEHGVFSVDAVYKSLDKYVAHDIKKDKAISGIYCYEDGAFYSFQQAKEQGIACLYDLPIGYWKTQRKLLETENQLNPEWATTLTGLKDSEKKLHKKDEELKLADLIIVASSFTHKTLHDYPGELKTIKVVPYGFPTVAERNYANIWSRKLKLIFVGGLSQRKGISYLFEAYNNLKNFIELTVVGRLPDTECKILEKNLSNCRYLPSLSHNEVLKLMQVHDVLVFPSLFEGFGQVITEAMAQGTPVITTNRTAGPDVIIHNENGWLIEAGSTEALQAAIETILQRPAVVKYNGIRALETAKKRPWKVYQHELVEIIEPILNHFEAAIVKR